MFGCLCSLAEFGPEMTQSAILPNFDQILESFAALEKTKGLGTHSGQNDKTLQKSKEVLRSMLLNLIDFIAVFKRADDSRG